VRDFVGRMLPAGAFAMEENDRQLATIAGTHEDSQYRRLSSFDSRGNPTLEAVVTLDSGVRGQGWSLRRLDRSQRGLELRDGDPERFADVRCSVPSRTSAGRSRRTRGQMLTDQVALDRRLMELDGTPNKSRLGANAFLGCRWRRHERGQPPREGPCSITSGSGQGTLFPLPEIQLFGGAGTHTTR